MEGSPANICPIVLSNDIWFGRSTSVSGSKNTSLIRPILPSLNTIISPGPDGAPLICKVVCGTTVACGLTGGCVVPVVGGEIGVV